MSENRNQLRDRALKATPGPWQHERLGIIQGGPMQTYVNGAAMPQLFTSHGADFMEPGEYLANADFVASANPAAVLAMLDEIDRLKADNAALEKRLCICQECGGRGEVHTGE
ncbi:ead/Ea22-like family protein [Pseudomonas oryzihabitans]|uniref:ead/Ea22-like family protein n=1 Tax=Pseudomonas oryzihabitans TaxID=47885 RepID=UPI001D3A5FCD|nr:ead/Ea22-like family protein [Pseudomonas oryzihabitans]HJE68855.1 ead/Ea22-like family protein [Pseudomonas oryzihabitans]